MWQAGEPAALGRMLPGSEGHMTCWNGYNQESRFDLLDGHDLVYVQDKWT